MEVSDPLAFQGLFLAISGTLDSFWLSFALSSSLWLASDSLFWHFLALSLAPPPTTFQKPQEKPFKNLRKNFRVEFSDPWGVHGLFRALFSSLWQSQGLSCTLFDSLALSGRFWYFLVLFSTFSVWATRFSKPTTILSRLG